MSEPNPHFCFVWPILGVRILSLYDEKSYRQETQDSFVRCF